MKQLAQVDMGVFFPHGTNRLEVICVLQFGSSAGQSSATDFFYSLDYPNDSSAAR